jgi:hypothetical protein
VREKLSEWVCWNLSDEKKDMKALKLSLLAVFMFTAAGVGSAAQPVSDVVSLDSGPTGGLVEEGVHRYLGIPYAAPPTGNFRWKPPQPVAPWTETRRSVLHALSRTGPTTASTARTVSI